MGRQTKGLTEGLVEAFLRPPGAEADASPILETFATRAVFLDELKNAGAVFSYPDALSVGEWAALLALGRARAKLDFEAKNIAPEDQRIRQSQAANQQALIAKTGRRG